MTVPGATDQTQYTINKFSGDISGSGFTGSAGGSFVNNGKVAAGGVIGKWGVAGESYQASGIFAASDRYPATDSHRAHRLEPPPHFLSLKALPMRVGNFFPCSPAVDDPRLFALSDRGPFLYCLCISIPCSVIICSVLASSLARIRSQLALRANAILNSRGALPLAAASS